MFYLVENDGRIVGQVLHIDPFGNVVTNIKEGDLPRDPDNLVLEISGRLIKRLVKTYADSGELCALIGSSGHLEIALPDGNAAKNIGASVGETVNASVSPKQRD